MKPVLCESDHSLGPRGGLITPALTFLWKSLLWEVKELPLGTMLPMQPALGTVANPWLGPGPCFVFTFDSLEKLKNRYAEQLFFI